MLEKIVKLDIKNRKANNMEIPIRYFISGEEICAEFSDSNPIIIWSPEYGYCA